MVPRHIGAYAGLKAALHSR